MKYGQMIMVCVVVAVAAFYGGMKYQGQGNPLDALKNMSQDERRQLFQQTGGGSGGNGNRGGRGGNGGAMGEILSKDDKSITVKLRDGGSKIIFYSDSTQIGKMAKGSKDDLSVGTNVFVNGAANQDGSVNAESIQIRPATQANDRQRSQ